MKVPDGEGVANRTGPESCVYIRKDMGEALTGDVQAGLLSRERYCKLRGADAVHESGRQHWYASLSRDVVGPCVVKDPEHVRKLFAREPGGPTFGLAGKQ